MCWFLGRCRHLFLRFWLNLKGSSKSMWGGAMAFCGDLDLERGWVGFLGFGVFGWQFVGDLGLAAVVLEVL